MPNPQLKQAITTIKAGDKQTGQQILRQLLDQEPTNEIAWLWLAAAVQAPTEKRECLQRVLELNPDNETAQRGLAELETVYPSSRPEPDQPDLPPQTSLPSIRKLATSTKKCPYCAETIKTEAAVCRYCGRALPDSHKPAVIETIPPSGSAALSWDEIWLRAVTQPSIGTFEALLADSHQHPNRAYQWIFFSSLVAAVLGFLGRFVVGLLTEASRIDAMFNLFLLLFGIFFGPFIAVITQAVYTAFVRWAAGMLGGRGSYAELLHLRAAYSAPLGMIYSAIAMIPVVNLLNIPLSIYLFVLEVMAVKAANRFGWGAAIAAVFIPLITLVGLSSCLLFVLLYELLSNR